MTAPTHLSVLAADLHASQRLYEETRVLLDQALTERDLARQTLADAPHGCDCRSFPEFMAHIEVDPLSCTCWKATL